jgi:uncharacterized protein (DUF1501 family)
MKRRQFLKAAGAAPWIVAGSTAAFAQAAAPDYRNLLVLVELKGGNDGLNTVVPYAEEAYYSLRPRLAIARDQVLQLDQHVGLHPALKDFLPLWQARELAVVQGVGYPSPNLSHFRSIEIWDTASRADEYLSEGWLTRAFARSPVPRNFAADGVVIGGQDLGPLSGVGPRVILLANPERFRAQSRLASPMEKEAGGALSHIMRVERDIVQAADRISGERTFRTAFPRTGFGESIRSACQVIASQTGVAVVRLSLNGFDTHSNQAPTHARLLQTLGEGMSALKSALLELGRWESTLIMTYAEFGRRVKENLSAGTDHGTASVHFLLGGRVRGGLYGQRPALDRLDGNGNLPFAVDFRDLYATVLERWWGVDSAGPLKARFAPIGVIT